jgi:PAS domain S-box-containing protein
MGPGEVIQHLPVAAMVVEAPSGRIVGVNARARDMVERQIGRAMPSELTSDWEIFHPDGRPYAMDEWPLIRSLKTGEVVSNEEYFSVLPDGSRLTVRCSSAPIHDHGQIIGGLLVMDDVTAQQRAADERAYHAILVDSVEDAVVGTDPEFRLTVWNRGAEHLYGYTADEVLGREARDIGTYEGDQSRLQLERELRETDRTRGDITAYRKDGTRVEVELVSVAVRSDAGQITGYLGIHRDVSERHRAEQAVRDAQRQTETILASILDAFVAVDREWRYTYINDVGLRRLEAWQGRAVTREELLGRSMWTVFPEVADTEVGRRLRDAMGSSEPVLFELHFGPTGEWVEVNAYPSPAGLSIYYRNISERKRIEEERAARARRQTLVAELSRRALISDDLQSLLDAAVRLVARLLDVERVEVGELLPDGDTLLMRAGVGWRPGTHGSEEPAGPGSRWAHALAEGAPVVTGDLGADPGFTPSPAGLEHGAVSAIDVLIQGPEGPFGMLAATATRRRAFSASDVDGMREVANVLAMAVQRVEYESRILEVRDNERRRIARDLHDDALQDLTQAIVDARGAVSSPADAHQRLAGLGPALERVGSQLRGAIYDLRLTAEEDRPFPELLTALVDLHRARAVDADLELRVGPGAPADPLGKRGTEILRIAGEAMTNARRHAGARQMRVTVSGSTERLRIDISDDGRGFDTGAALATGEGTGLQGMRERAALLDGDLEIVSEPGAGTLVRLSVPLTGGRDRSDETVRVLLVEDHTAVREAIAGQFEREPGFEVVGQAGSLAQARALITEQIDVAVVDLGLPDGDGSELIRDLRQVNPRAHALVLTATLDRAQAARAVQSGASATLDKTAHLHEVVDAVRRVRAGETLLDVDEVADLLRFAGTRREREREHRQAIERLTPREREVLQALADGLSSQAIADRLQITTRTQRNHVANILTKLGVHSQLQAVLFALRYEVVELH